MKLYHYFRSSASFRVRIVLHLKEVTYEDISVHLLNNGGEQFSPTYKTLNPAQLVPLWQEGDRIISQSLAIIEYLNDLYPTPPLWPENPYHKALIKSMALSITADIHPLNNLRVLRYLKDNLNVSEEQKNTWYKHWIEKGLTAFEQQLNQYNFSGLYCFGNSPTLADVCLIPQLYNAKRYACDLNVYPTLMRIHETCKQHPAFVKAWPIDE